MPAKKARKAPSEEPAEPEKKREEEVVAVAAEPEKRNLRLQQRYLRRTTTSA